MKKLLRIFAVSLGLVASSAQADQIIIIDGEAYSLSQLAANCQSMADAAGQIACFTALSKLVAEQSSSTNEDKAAAIENALQALKSAASYSDADSGLDISGSSCEIQMTYYGNYFHISRRNISTIDLLSATFDASNLRIDQVIPVQGAQVPVLQGTMANGANAKTQGGLGLDSARDNFVSRPAGATLQDYAHEVVSVLPVRQNQTFNFMLVHPNRDAQRSEIWTAFETFVKTCQS